MIIFWAAAVVVFIIVEAMTVGLTSIWLAIGALAALVCASLDAVLWLQIAVFLITSGLALWITRPLAKKHINAKHLPTNADRVIGNICLVSEEIDNITGKGAVAADGKRWTARSRSGEGISEGARVKVVAIDGVKLIVEPETAAQSEV